MYCVGVSKELSRRIRAIDERCDEVSSKLLEWKNIYVVSSGINYPIALEAALKFKEATLYHAEGVQLGELRYGPMVLL